MKKTKKNRAVYKNISVYFWKQHNLKSYLTFPAQIKTMIIDRDHDHFTCSIKCFGFFLLISSKIIIKFRKIT